MPPVAEAKKLSSKGPGDYFGEISLVLEDGRRQASVRALDRCVTLKLQKHKLEEFFEHAPEAVSDLQVCGAITVVFETTKKISNTRERKLFVCSLGCAVKNTQV